MHFTLQSGSAQQTPLSSLFYPSLHWKQNATSGYTYSSGSSRLPLSGSVVSPVQLITLTHQRLVW